MDEIKVLARRWFEEVWNEKRVEAIDEMLAPHTLAHGLNGEVLRGPEGFRSFYSQFVGALPDVHMTVQEVLVEGNKAATFFSGTGTHQGGDLGVPATGRPVAFSGMSITRWEDGRIVEAWNVVDLLPMFQTIGLVTPAAS